MDTMNNEKIKTVVQNGRPISNGVKKAIIIISALFILTSFIVLAHDNEKEIVPRIKGTYDDLKWQRCLEFHGHEWAGTAIGFRVAEAVAEKLHITFSEDEELVCVTENDAWAPDAIAVAVGCSLGKGNLILRNTGKMVFNFFNRKTGKKLRIYYKGVFGKKEGQMSSQERMLQTEYVLKAPLDEIFDFSQPKFEAPEESRIFGNINCEICGETAPEHKIRLQDNKKVCLDCFKQ